MCSVLNLPRSVLAAPFSDSDIELVLPEAIDAVAWATVTVTCLPDPPAVGDTEMTLPFLSVSTNESTSLTWHVPPPVHDTGALSDVPLTAGFPSEGVGFGGGGGATV